MKNVAIGQYYPTDSFIHSLDPRLKLVALFAFITILFTTSGFVSYFFVMAGTIAVIYASNVPISFILRSVRGVMVVVAFTAILNMFFTPGEYVLVKFFGITLYLEGLLTAIRMCLRILLLIMASSVLTLTTAPISLTDGMEYLMKPLKRIGVPAHEIAMMMTIALRFIPTLIQELDKIMKAQMARGADFDTGGLVQKAKSLVPLLVPLFVSAFRRAEDLAMAMEARCYRGDEGRTRLKALSISKLDIRAIWIMAAFGASAVLLNIFLV